MSDTVDVIRKMQKDVVSNMQEDSQRTLDLITGVLVGSDRTMCSVLPEHIFVQYFLPYFAGQPSSRPNILAEWISIAGTPMSEVAIIDGGRNVMYYIPPVFDTSFIAAKKSDTMTFGQMSDQANLLNNNLPVLSERFMVGAMDQKYREIAMPASVNQSNEQRWVDIFIRYGYKAPSVATHATTNVPLPNIADDEVYD